jgi:transcriptional regulator GlxA family with amidase domain
MTTATPKKARSLRVGVLIVGSAQFLDASPIDLFGMCSTEYLTACRLPQPLLNLGIPVDIHYISDGEPGSLVELTANAKLQITDSLASLDVQPGKLDTLLIPGPDPNVVPEQSYLEFIQAHENAGQTDFIVICTGAYPAGYAGLLDGKKITGPRALVSDLQKKFPRGKYTDRRWERDGRLWSSGKWHYRS